MTSSNQGTNGQSSPAVQICLLVAPQWRTRDGGTGSVNRKDAAMLAMLALDGPKSRQAIAGTFWPKVSDRSAGVNLRQRIAQLRRQTGHDLLRTGGASMRLAEGVAVDACRLHEMSLDELLDAGELLAGYEYDDNDIVQDWVARHRERCRRARCDALATHVGRLEREGQIASALRVNERILALVPDREHAWRWHMRLHYLRGDRSAAIAAFERFEALLKESGARPSAETCELLRTIEHAIEALPTRRAVLPASLLKPPRLVGRDRELEEMDRAWQAGQAFVLSADAGMGKSRLLNEYLEALQGVVSDQARPGDAQTPYAVLGRLLRVVVGRRTAPLAEVTRSELARLLPELGAPASAPAQQAVLWHAVEALLVDALAGGLVAIVVDDLHQADVATLDVLRWLSASRELAALHFGFAARPNEGAEIAAVLRAWYDDSHRAACIVLRALSAADVGALLATLELPQLAQQGFAEQLHRHAGGHPMFMLETLKHIVVSGTSSSLDALPLPVSVQALLERRLEALSPAATDLARTVAICGDELTPARASRLLGRTVVELATPWNELEAGNVLRDQRFTHELLRESALRLTPPALQRALHEKLARSLGEDPLVPAGRVAAHWQAAENWPLAGEAWKRAGMVARHAGRMVEHRTLLEKAADCYRRAGDKDGEFDALLPGMDAMLVNDGAQAVFEALPYLESLAGTRDRQAQALMCRAQALVVSSMSEEGLAVSALAIEAARAYPALLADALSWRGMALAQCGRWTEAIDVQREALAMAQAGSDKPQTLRAASALAFALAQAGRFVDAAATQRDALQLAHDIGDLTDVAMCESNLASYVVMCGELHEGYRLATRARERHERMGPSVNSIYGSINLVNVGGLAAYFGKFDESVGALEEALRVMGEGGNPSMIAKGRIVLADVWRSLGRTDRAQQALAAPCPPASPLWRALWHLAKARTGVPDGAGDAAHVASAERLIADHPVIGADALLLFAWSRHGEASAMVERLIAARSRCESLGQHGVARALALREIARRLELDGAKNTERGAMEAGRLLDRVATDMQTTVHPPEAWDILAAAFERNREPERAAQCRVMASRWVHETALPNVREEDRARFLAHHAVHADTPRESAGGSARTDR